MKSQKTIFWNNLSILTRFISRELSTFSGIFQCMETKKIASPWKWMKWKFVFSGFIFQNITSKSNGVPFHNKTRWSGIHPRQWFSACKSLVFHHFIFHSWRFGNSQANSVLRFHWKFDILLGIEETALSGQLVLLNLWQKMFMLLTKTE